LTSSTP